MRPVLLILVSVLAVVLALSAAGLALAQQGGQGGPPPPPKVDIEPESNPINPMAAFAATTTRTRLVWKVDGQTATGNDSRVMNVRFKINDIEKFEVLVGQEWKKVNKALEIKITDKTGKILRTISVMRHSGGQGKPERVKWVIKKGTEPGSEVPESTTADPNGLPREFFADTAAGESWEMKADGSVVKSGMAKIYLMEGA
jgi:hypothetical protein